jgi:hypothetical protein
MERTIVDATDVTREALLGTDGEWYEAYWLAGDAETKLRLLARLTGQPAIPIRAARAGHFVRAGQGSARARTASVGAMISRAPLSPTP